MISRTMVTHGYRFAMSEVKVALEGLRRLNARKKAQPGGTGKVKGVD